MNKQGQISTSCPQTSETCSNLHFIEKLTSQVTGKKVKIPNKPHILFFL